MDKDSGGIQVIARAAAILRALGREGVSLGALAKQTGLPRSTVQRIVDALAAEHFVEAGEAGVRLGWGLAQLAKLSQSDIVLAARPHLEALFDATHESVDIAARAGRETSFLDRIVSDQELRVVPMLGKPHPLYAMANGKALLAAMIDADVTRLFADGLAPLTPHTLTSIDALLADLATARASGFTYDREEHALGVCAIGMSIRVDGWPAHAISIAVPASRFEASLPRLQTALRQARDSIEGELS
jgi:DNA-binding IclR family transcriptional regulator